jgi:hypothetical protein
MNNTLQVLSATLGFLIVTGPLAIVCAAPQQATPQPVTVEHATISQNLPEWRIAPTPDLRIGKVDGRDPDVFGSIVSVVERSDGVIVVADGRSFQLKAFDPTGRHLWSAGREGPGPGEFGRALMGLTHSADIRLRLMPGDSTIAFDGSNRWLHVFDSSGTYRRSLRLRRGDLSTAEPILVGVLADGTLVGRQQLSPTGPGGDGIPVRRRSALSFHAPDGLLLLEPQVYPDAATASLRSGNVYGSIPVLMSPQAVFSARGARAVATSQDRFEVNYYSGSGSLVMTLRVGIEPVPITNVIRSRALADRSPTPSGRNPPVFLETLPAMGNLMLDDQGRLWIEEYVPEYEQRKPVWWIFGSDAMAIARTSFPDRFTPHHIGRDYVIGVSTDELGVAYVERRRFQVQVIGP